MESAGKTPELSGSPGGTAGLAGAAVRMSGHWRTHMTKGHQLPRLSSLWAPAVMALEKRPLLLLTLVLGLASAQETLEEVPVQPAFDAQKVAAWVRYRTQPRDEGMGQVSQGRCSGARQAGAGGRT